MYRFRFIKRFIRERKKFFLIGLVLLLIILSAAIYLKNQKSPLIYNKYIYNEHSRALMGVFRSLKDFVNKMPNILYLNKMKKDVNIPSYQLIIKGDNLKKLNDNLPKPIINGTSIDWPELTDEFKKTVPAKFIAGNKEYKVKIRYRGDHSSHWTKPKRSWQIIFDKDNLFNGLKVIKLIVPVNRNYFAEYLNSYRAKKFGLTLTEANFAELKVNNKNYGVYYQFEDWSKELLEKNQLPADANLYVTNDDTINLNQKNFASNDIQFWKKKASDKIFNYNNYSEIDFLLSLQDRDNFSDILPNIINLDNFYHWNALSILAGSSHQCDQGNWRMYFNNSNGKFEFIPWDVKIAGAIDDRILSNILVGKILSDPWLEHGRNQVLWNYVNDERNLNDDLGAYDQIYNKLKPAFYANWNKFHNNHKFDKEIKRIREGFIDVFNKTKQLFLNDNSSLDLEYQQSKQLINVDLVVDNFSGLILESLSLPFEDSVNYVELYYDVDENGILNTSDTLIARSTFFKKEQEFLLDNLNQFFFSQRIYQEDIAQSSLIPKKYTLFIKSNNNSKSMTDAIEFHFINAVTKQVVQINN